MYKKAVGLLALGSVIFLACLLCVRGVDAVMLCSRPARALKLELDKVEERALELETGWSMDEGPGREARRSLAAGQGLYRREKVLGIMDRAVSGQRVIAFSVLKYKYAYELSEENLEVLLRIVEAEAGNEDADGKLLVANVVLNRVKSEEFPDTVSEVVFQNEDGVAQFSPVANGSYFRVQVSSETVSAVERALSGEDISQGALYFMARKYADQRLVRWFDESLTYLFQHGGHEFFR